MPKSKKQIQILGIVLFLLAVYSAEAFLYVKDADLFEASLQAGLADSFDTYLSLHLVLYVQHILIPVLFAAAVFLIPAARWNRLFRGIFTLLLASGAIFRLIEWQTGSVFYYLSLAGYLALIAVFNHSTA